MSEQAYDAATIHSLPWVRVAWCRHGVMLGKHTLIWWGRWGDFLATMKLVHAAVAEAEASTLRWERDEAREDARSGSPDEDTDGRSA